MNKKFIIIATVFIDVLGMGIIIPTLPFYVQSFGVSAFTITLLFCIFSLFSFISAPFLGVLSDRIGRKLVLIISICSTALGWFVFAGARSIIFLFIGRIIDGLAAGNFSAAQSYLVEIAQTKEERTKNLGIIGAVFGIAFVVGPGIGGLLSTVSATFPFWCVGVLASLNAINAIFFLPESLKTKNTTHTLSLNPLSPIARIFQNKETLPHYTLWFLFGLAVALYQAVFSLYLGTVFNYGAFVSGLFLTGVGVIMSINQAFLLPRFWLKKFNEKNLELAMAGLFTIGFVLMCSSWIGIFIAGLIALVLSQSVLRIVLTAQTVGKSDENKRGEILGALTAVMSLSMVIGPLLAGALYTFYPQLPFIISTVLALSISILLYCIRKKINTFSPTPHAVPDQTLL